MNYVNSEELKQKTQFFTEYIGLLTEYGFEKEINEDFEKLLLTVNEYIEKSEKRVIEFLSNNKDSNSLKSIFSNSCGNNPILEVHDLKNKIKGAIIARFAGCTLGAIVENWPIERMQKKATYEGLKYPPDKYWQSANDPFHLQYGVLREGFTENGMKFCPSDDDITYTVLALLIMEKYGLNFTTEDVGNFWKEYLPLACTAEDVALKNLKNNITADKAGETYNPYSNLIGALIRADGFSYACAGNPHKAAELCFNDAYLTHRFDGIYGEMLFGAAIAAAFGVDDSIEAIKIGLNEIPVNSMLYGDITWALNNLENVKTYEDARKLVDERFKGQHSVHTNNNACLIVFALHIGKNDVEKSITNAVAMGLDNDCTAATVGSITGAISGFSSIPEKWYKNFNNTVRTYINNNEFFNIDDLVERFYKLNF